MANMGFRRLAYVGVFCILALLCCGCTSAPPVIIDTTAVDGIILDLSGTAGTIETQTITVYETVTKYVTDPKAMAEIDAEFSTLRASITHLKTIPGDLSRVHAIEVGKLGSEIVRLAPFEVKLERVTGQRNTLFFVCVSLVLVIGCAIVLKLKGWP